jgi:hypothetical protein
LYAIHEEPDYRLTTGLARVTSYKRLFHDACNELHDVCAAIILHHKGRTDVLFAVRRMSYPED